MSRLPLHWALLALGLGCADARTDIHDGLLSDADDATARTAAQAGAVLPPRRSCEAVEDETIRGRLIEEMKARLATQRAAEGRGCFIVPQATAPTGAPEATRAGSPGAVGGSAAAGPTSVSRTNNQVEGVDEADMVKTDDGVMYVASGDALHVLSAWPAAETREIARVPLKGRALKLFVAGGRAVVYAAVGARGGSVCTYGYDCSFTGDGSSTQMTVLDVQNPAAPRVVREIALSGALIAARRIDGAVYTVVADLNRFTYPVRPANRSFLCKVDMSDDERAELDDAYAKLARDNEALIRQVDLTSLLPKVEDTVPGAERACGSLRTDFGTSGLAFTSVHAFDLAADAPASVETLVSRPGAVYVSEEHLYFAVTDAPEQTFGLMPPGAEPQGRAEQSRVHKFRLDRSPPGPVYEASATVKGHVLNQFAMDEWAGALRIATTTGRVPDPDTESTISVLDVSGTSFRRIGELTGIAKTEDIRSVRFVGSRGYVVTFKKTDPLFVFDLAEATAPRIWGELKIPGFSTYMHPLDDDHLLTIGYDADDQGSFAYFQGVLLQIFDVRDPSQPKLRHKAVIGTRGSSSEALGNHLAFNYFPERKLLALPMTICEGGQAGSFGTRMSFSGLMLFDVDVAAGLAQRGRVAHPSLTTGRYDGSCNNWWTNASSVVKRSVFMDDFVYSIADDVVRVQALDQLGRDVATVPLSSATQRWR